MLEGVEALRPRGVVVAHLRKASLGSVSKENTQPFIHDQWAFAHNGTIHDFQKPVPLRLQGTTDSERYFKAILGAMERGLPFRDALAEVTSWIRSTHSFTSLTLLMSDGYSLYGYREFADLPEYYTLYYARRDDAVVFSQEPLDEGPWRLMENRQLLTVGSDLSLSFRQL
jgi:predicted glutamine amidotransferase